MSGGEPSMGCGAISGRSGRGIAFHQPRDCMGVQDRQRGRQWELARRYARRTSPRRGRQISATTPRSCVISKMLIPSAVEVAEQRRGSEPGSSHRARWSARRRSAIPGATRAQSRSSRAGGFRPRADAGMRVAQLRIGMRLPGGVGGLRRPRARSRPWWRRTASADLITGGEGGFSEVIGSWKIIEMLLPRKSSIARSGRDIKSRSWKRIRPETSLPGGIGTRRMIERAVTPLAGTGLTGQTRALPPGESSRLTPSTARMSLVRVPNEIAQESLDLEQRSGAIIVVPAADRARPAVHHRED